MNAGITLFASVLATLQAASGSPPQINRAIVAPSPPQQATDKQDRQSDDQPDDIIVEGYRSRGDLRTKVTPPSALSIIGIRRTYEYSEAVAKCAARSRLSDLKRLRDVVDGEFGTTTQTIAQDRLKRTYISCSESTALLSRNSRPPTSLEIASVMFAPPGTEVTAGDAPIDPAPLGHSIYDRGAFIIEAMKRFSPTLTLTRDQTNDPVVQSRFNLREVPLNRYRLPQDYKYFQVAVCMVRVEPKLSVRLAMSGGSVRYSDLQAALIDRARICVGGSRDVKVDPTQFRIYIADAVYRWAVAAKGVESLIPDHA